MDTPSLADTPVIDLATLTGAQKVALGNHIAAVLGTDDAVELVTAAAEAALPLRKRVQGCLKFVLAKIRP